MSDASIPDLTDQREELFAAAYNTIQDVEQVAQHELGPTTFDDLRYPYAEVIPQTSAYQGGNEFRHLFATNFYFVKERHEDYLSYLRVVHAAMPLLSDAFLGVSDAYSVRPTEIQDFAGEVDDDLIIMLSVTWQVDTLADSAE